MNKLVDDCLNLNPLQSDANESLEFGQSEPTDHLNNGVYFHAVV